VKRLIMISGAAVVVGALGLVLSVSAATSRASSEDDAASPASPRPTLARVATVERHPLSRPIRAAGQVRAKSQIDLGFLIGGQVAWIGVDVGNRVRRGQVLARLDRTALAADDERARAAEQQSQRDLNRATHLQASGAVPASALESAQTGHAVAAAQARSAAFALRHGVLVAPDDGVIDARLVERGQTVGPGQPAFRMSGKSRGDIVRVSLSESDVVGLDIGRLAHVRLDAIGEKVYEARVSQVAPVASPASGAFAVDVRLDGMPAEARSGMTAKVDIDRLAEVGSIVPVSALVPGEREGASVVAVVGGVAHRRPVHVVFIEGTRAALAERLVGVSEVATLGAGMLADGSPVEIVRP
jgi:RND family efflux transporter MFP subunit